ncbi:branched-chain amino acid ABC transporter, permease protein [Brucella vulpis]|nr:branched-chain amino acid ABC transporter, permease protein [Brucella vulpis]CUW49899.1 branched-chain amino acid ABC transporter, permease protein [Brucella vulpis]
MAVQTGSRPDSLFGRALREGIMAGLLALGLFCLIIGFKTDQNINNELVLEQRWGTLAIMVAIAAVGRFLFIAFLQPWLEARKLAKSSRPAVSTETLLLSAAISRASALPSSLSIPFSSLQPLAGRDR